MYSVLARLRQAAQEGMTDTQGEFGVLLSITPLSVKLDEDPTPLEAYELEVLRSANLRVEDIGRKVALLRCTNGQYLLCGGGGVMFPELSGSESSLMLDTQRPIPWTYRFDWQTRQMRQGPDGRYLRTTTYAEYLEEIAKKLLNTRRFRYAIYSERIGVDFLSEIGRLKSGISLAVIRAQAEEALEAHSEIERAQVLDIQVQDKRILFSLELTGSRGSTRSEWMHGNVKKPDMPILRETADQIYQRMANRMALLAEQQGDTPPATEEGEIFYDLLYPLAQEISEQQQLLEYAFLQGFLPWADDEYLDAHGMFFGLKRNDGEENDAFRSRLLERARTEEGDGRRGDYERWARDINGVGGAVAIEKARNDLSIDVYITDVNGQPASLELAEQVEKELSEKRRALHDLKVLPANIFEVEIAVQLVLGKDAVLATVKEEITKQITTYLKGRSTIVYQQIGSLFFVNGVEDFTQYTLNGGTSNVIVEGDAVSILRLVVTT